MMILSCITDDFARIANAQSDETAELLINKACQAAVAEIRTFARQARTSEKNIREGNKTRSKEQEKIAAKIREGHESEIEIGRERNRKLAAAESFPGVPRIWR